MRYCGGLLFFCFLSSLFLFLMGCQGVRGNKKQTQPPPGPITVTVSPATVTVAAGSTFSAFVATVTNTTNTSVNWFVDNAAGGNSAVGTIDASGHYTAPAAAATGSALLRR